MARRISVNADTAWKQRILDEMQAQGLSQRRLAKKSKLGSTSIRHILLKAGTISLETCIKVATALGCTPEYIAFGLNPPPRRKTYEELLHFYNQANGRGAP